MKTTEQSLKKLSNEQLRGCEWGWRYLRTSPLIRGQALALLDDLIEEANKEMADGKRRKKKAK